MNGIANMVLKSDFCHSFLVKISVIVWLTKQTLFFYWTLILMHNVIRIISNKNTIIMNDSDMLAQEVIIEVLRKELPQLSSYYGVERK